MDIEKILQRVPDYPAFYTVDELARECERLAREFPQSVSRLTIGHSTKGEPLLALRLGSGAKNALCYACPHPNEPIGAMTLITLARILASDPEFLQRTGYTWWLIPCVDPDGTRLNEGWFKGPFNIENYVRGFYRPAGRFQVEWTFPFNYKGHTWDTPIAETRALMAQIGALKPEFVFSLHNCAFGGAYWYLNTAPGGLCEALEGAAVRQGIPLHLGEPESPYVAKLSKAVHEMLSMRAYYDWQESQGRPVKPGPMSCGTCGADYIETVCKSLILMAELPYFLVEGIDDSSLSGMTRRQALDAREDRRSASYMALGELWRKVRPFIGGQNPFPYMVDGAVEMYADGKRERFEGEQFDRTASRAEVLDCLYTTRIFEALDHGLAWRSCLYELERTDFSHQARGTLESAVRELDARIREQCAALESGAKYSACEIGRLVKVQLESALCAIEYA